MPHNVVAERYYYADATNRLGTRWGAGALVPLLAAAKLSRLLTGDVLRIKQGHPGASEYFECVAALLFLLQSADSHFQFGEAIQAREQAGCCEVRGQLP